MPEQVVGKPSQRLLGSLLALVALGDTVAGVEERGVALEETWFLGPAWKGWPVRSSQERWDLEESDQQREAFWSG